LCAAKRGSLPRNTASLHRGRQNDRDESMRTITRVKNVLHISLDPVHNDEFDWLFTKLSNDLFELTRGLYRYEVYQRFDVYNL
jgi:hypothetical protein